MESVTVRGKINVDDMNMQGPLQEASQERVTQRAPAA